MAGIDTVRFGLAVVEALERHGLSYAEASARFAAVDKAMLSRAVHAKALSAGNYLVLCDALELEPRDFLVREPRSVRRLKDIAARLEKGATPQGVTRPSTRETRDGARS